MSSLCLEFAFIGFICKTWHYKICTVRPILLHNKIYVQTHELFDCIQYMDKNDKNFVIDSTHEKTFSNISWVSSINSKGQKKTTNLMHINEMVLTSEIRLHTNNKIAKSKHKRVIHSANHWKSNLTTLLVNYRFFIKTVKIH